MKNEELVKQLTSPSKNSRLEKFGKTITFLCLALIVFIVAMILLFVAQKGLATFFVNKVSLIEFLFSGDWSPSEGKFGALPMILGSFVVTLLSALVATPFAIGAAIFMTEISPKGAKFLQPAIELLDSICCLWFHWSPSGGPICSLNFWWHRVWYSFRYLCLVRHDSTNRNLYDNRYASCSASSLS